MRTRWIWLAALVLYGAFRLWYDAWGGPLRPDEVEHHMQTFAARAEAPDPDRLARLRAFLESDDGGEFFMVNLIRLHPDPVPMPDSGEPAPAAEVLARYTDAFLPGVFRRAGHPIFVGPAVGSYLESWDVEPDPGWTVAGLVRYRSRRDMIELVTSPDFDPAHAYKIAAISHTLAFPATARIQLFGPRLAVALALALAAALAQLALRRRG